MNTNSKTSLLREHQTISDTNSIPLCGFLSVKYYQPYFDVDTSEVTDRIWSSLFFCRREQTFLDQIGAKISDVYGPFWVIVL